MRHGETVLAALWAALVLGGAADAQTETAAPPAAFPPAEQLDLEAYRGRVVVLNFWATWCLPCRQEVPALVELDGEYRERGLAVLGISVDRQGTAQEVERQLRRFVEEYGIEYEVYVDGDLKLVKEFGDFAAIPRTFVLDGQGEVAHTFDGAASHDELVEVIEPLLAQASRDAPAVAGQGPQEESE